MKFLITGITEGEYGGNNTPLTLSNLFRLDQDIPEIPAETDPTVPQHVKDITEQDIINFLKDTDTTYEVFTSILNGLVPAPPSTISEGGTNYSVEITQPIEGQEFTEGEVVTITGSVTEETSTQYSISITHPTEGQEFTEGETVTISAEVEEIQSSSERLLVTNDFSGGTPWKTEQDPTVPQHVKDITSTDIEEWVTGFNNNIISGTVTGDNNKVITLTKRDGSTLTIPFIDNIGTVGDDVLNTLSFNSSNGVLTAVTSDGIQITTNLDGRYALIGHTHNYENPLTFSDGTLTKATRVGDEVKIDKIPKESVDIAGSSPSLPSNYNSKWLNLTGADPTLTISGTFSKDNEIEGSFSGTGRLTIVGGTGITLIYPTEFFTNTYPEGGVFGIKFTSATEAVLFGKQIPIGI